MTFDKISTIKDYWSVHTANHLKELCENQRICVYNTNNDWVEMAGRIGMRIRKPSKLISNSQDQLREHLF